MSNRLLRHAAAGSIGAATFLLLPYAGWFFPVWLCLGAVGWRLRKRFPLEPALVTVFGLAFCAVAAPLLAPFDPQRQFTVAEAHLMGLDRLGRDLFSRLVFGHRNAVLIAAAGSALAGVTAMAVGGALALGPARLRKAADMFIQAFLAIPILIYYLLALAFLDPGPGPLILLLGLTLWPEPARILQARLSELRGADFVQAARMRGKGSARVFFDELLPNLVPLVAVNAMIVFINAILLEAILSYLGLGLRPGAPSLGGFIEYGARHMDRNPFPLLAAMAVLLAWIGSLRILLHRFGRVNRPLRIE